MPQVKPRPNSAVPGGWVGRVSSSCLQIINFASAAAAVAAGAAPSLLPVVTANDVSSSIFQGLQVQFSNGNQEGRNSGGASDVAYSPRAKQMG